MDAMSTLVSIATRKTIDSTAEAWLLRSFSAWLADGADPDRLVAFLQLERGSRAAISRRNHWLRLAAAELPEHQRAANLKRAIDQFARKRWPAWRGQTVAPDDATPIEQALWYAFDSGATMAITRRQVCNILCEK